MKRVMLLLALAGLGGGGWYASQNMDLKDIPGLKLVTAGGGGNTAAPEVKRTGDTIRIASFNLQSLGRTKLEKPHVMEYIARNIRQFDVVALQEIRSRDESVLPRLVDLVNATGRQYDYVIGPRVGPTATTEQFAFVFDRASLEVDRNQLYTVDDPDDLIRREPLVAWFRVRGPAPEAAFTFTLVNVHVDSEDVEHELPALAQVFRGVRNDNRGEDDVILLGDFSSPHDRLGPLGAVPGITAAIMGLPTNVRGTEELDNLLFHREATKEFTGRSGVFDFLREYNLSLDAAAEVSDHIPVWAEFSIYEGGQPGRVAETSGGSTR